MGQAKPGADFKRRLSRPELPGISAIFNPRKLRRNSAAVTQLIQSEPFSSSSAQRPPAVVVTDDNLSDQVDFGSGGGSFDQDRLAFGTAFGIGMSNGPSGSGCDGPGMSRAARGGGGMSAGSGTSASSVPLLADVQAQSGHNAIVTLESIQSSNPNPSTGNPQSANPNANLKPIAKTFATIRRAVFSKTARKLCCGLFLSVLVGCCWTAMIHAVKRAYITTYFFQIEEGHPTELHPMGPFTDQAHENNSNHSNNNGVPVSTMHSLNVYDAPFFTAWLLSIATVFFYPLHQVTVYFCSCMGRKGPKTMSRAISDAVQGFRERGMTLFQFLGRCTVLCSLWLLTNWLLVASLRVLRATEVLALFATTTSFVYLLSWVVLHQQFVGLRIFAVILSNMGIALLAYMDGQTHKSPTVGCVLLGATAAGASAVFKVSLKKSFGFGATVSQQVALIFSVVGLLAALILWPIFVTLYFTGVEVIRWAYVPWEFIILAVICSLMVSMLDNFGVTCTFEFFITIGLLMAIPFSAALDIHVYDESFQDMRLAGIITVGIGFCVVLLPENWPDYITRLIRYLAQLKHHSRWGRNRRGLNNNQEPIDTRTGHIRSHLRSPSGRVR